MVKPLVSDEPWDMLQPLLPPAKPRRFRHPGRRRIDDRKALTGILFALKSGIPYPLGDVAQGDGMWVGDDLLAPSERVA